MEATAAARLIVDGRTNSSWSSSPFLSQILLAMQKLHQTLQLLSFFSKRGKKSLRRCLRITASYVLGCVLLVAEIQKHLWHEICIDKPWLCIAFSHNYCLQNWMSARRKRKKSLLSCSIILHCIVSS